MAETDRELEKRMEKTSREYGDRGASSQTRKKTSKKLKRVLTTTGKIGKRIVSKKLPNIKERGAGRKAFKGISGVYGYRKELSRNLNKQFSGAWGGGNQTSQKRVKDGPGRPRGDFKHRSPFTGQPIPATEYYKQIREFRRRQEQKARMEDTQRVAELAKRGIPPEQAKVIVDTKQLRSVGVQVQPSQVQQLTPEQLRQMEIQRQMNQNQSNAVRPIWRRNNVVRYERDAFGRLRVVQGGNDPKNFWN